MMTILVTGANGQLGNEMRLISAASTDRFIFTDVVELPGVQTTILDMTDQDAVRRIVKDNDVKVIVNCAAYTNVDKAEDDVELCSLLNAEAPEILASVMKEAYECSALGCIAAMSYLRTCHVAMIYRRRFIVRVATSDQSAEDAFTAYYTVVETIAECSV